MSVEKRHRYSCEWEDSKVETKEPEENIKVGLFFLYDGGQTVHVMMVISTLVASCALDMCWRRYGEAPIACCLLCHRNMMTLLPSGFGVDWMLWMFPGTGEASP